jgi:PAS domain S-box-containing protein
MSPSKDPEPLPRTQNPPHDHLLKILLDNLPNLVYVMDLGGRILLASRSMEELFGVSPGGLEGRTPRELMSAEEAAQRQEADHAALRLEGPAYSLDRLQRPDGEKVFLAVKVPWRDQTGQIAGIAGISTDITELQFAQQRLRTSEEAHRLLFEKNPQPMWLYDRDTLRFLAVNEAAVQVYGFSKEEFLSMTLEDIRPPEEVPAFRDRLSASGEGYNLSGEFRHRTKSGGRLDVEIRRQTLEWEGRHAGLVVAFDITERKRLQEQLRASEEVHRLLFEKNPQPMWVYDLASLRFLAVNEAAVRRYGYSRDEFLQMTLADIRPAEDLSRLYADIAATRDVLNLAGEWRHLTKHGEILDVEIRSHLLDWEGRAARLVVAFDITARKKASAELDRFFQLSQDLLCIATREGRFIRLNPQWSATFGYTLEEMVGRSADEFVHPDDVAATLHAGWSVNEATSLRDFVNRYRCRDGSYRILEWHSYAAGEVIYSVARDITEKRRTDDLLRLLSRAVEQSPSGVIITDPRGSIEYVNPRFEKLTGYSAQEVIGQNPRILQSGRTSPDHYAQLWRTILAGEVWEGEFENKKKDGSLYHVRASISPVRDEKGEIRHFVAVQEDITENRRLQAQFLQAQKMEAIGLLAGGVAHDFNNLLTIINGYTEMVLQNHMLPDATRALLTPVLRAGEQAANLTRQLLMLGRAQPDAPVLIETGNVLANLNEFFRRILPANIRLEITVRARPAVVKADPTLLQQVVMNLVLNARDAMPEGGRLRIEVDRTSVPEQPGQRPLQGEITPGSYIVLEISDSGAGMSEEVQRHLFEPFFSTKPQGRGTGLGLATVYGIVRQYGGFIEVRSAPGAGASFRVLLPDAGAPAPEHLPEVAGSLLPRGAETVLVVEDAPEVRQLTADSLKNLGYTVLTAGSGEEAIALARQHQGTLDLLFTDVMLPGISGPDTARAIQELFPGIGVLFASGYVAGDAELASLRQPGVHFLSKPFPLAELAVKLRETLESRAPAARILVVDDDESIRDLFAAILTEAHYEVATARNGDEALVKMESFPADLLLLDLVMPDREGIETLAELRKRGHPARVIAMSGAFGGQFLRVAQVLGADATLLKPIARAGLLETVRKVLASPPKVRPPAGGS